MAETGGALAGIRVVDLTRVLAGPYCTQLLGDLGADVIKIERPGAGDDTRRFGPPFLKGTDGKETRESAYFMSANRNKRSLALDITHPEGQAIVRRLIAKADVVVENFKTGNLAKYGLGYDDLRKEHPGLVYCSITGFGQTGPYAERPGYDFLIQAMGGIMSLTGEPDGDPQKVGVPIADLMAGMFATVSVIAAIRHRDRTGEGQYIDIGMLDTQVAWLANAAMNYLYSGDLGRLGNAHPNIVPYQVFPTADGFIVVAVGNDSQFARFCEVAAVADLAAAPRFATNDARVRNRAELVPKLRAVFATRTSADWLAALEAEGIGCGPINTLAQVFADPHVIDRGMVVEVPHPAIGGAPARIIGSPLRLSATPVAYRRHPPRVGEHTLAVLGEELGLGKDEIARLKEAKVI
ncbi:MAG: CoA transferase [Alphaproteobacteria bacterium]|nr:CoA transferase [Alphaproteobacteria bacterium]